MFMWEKSASKCPFKTIFKQLKLLIVMLSETLRTLYLFSIFGETSDRNIITQLCNLF